MAKPLMSDAEIRHRKKLQGQISRTTSTLGLTGLGLLGASAVTRRSPGALKALNRGPGMKKITPSKLKDHATTVGLVSGGIGGVGGYNFAAYTGAESRKRTIKKEHTMMDFGLGGVQHGDSERAVEIEKSQDWMNISEHQRRARDSRRVKRNAGATAMYGAAGTVALGQAGGFRQMPTVTRATNANFSMARHGHQSFGQAVKHSAKIARARPKGALTAAGVGVTAGAIGATYGAAINEKRHDRAISRQRKNRDQQIRKNVEIFKAYDPERSRQRRLDHASTGFAVGAGAAAAGAAITGKKAYKPLKAIAGTKRGKDAFGHGGKAAVLAGTSIGAAVASDRIRSYKAGRGGSLKPLRGYAN